MDNRRQAELWNKEYATATAEELLAFFISTFRGRIKLGSSLGLEDQVLTHMIWKIDPGVEIFTLDTGRLFPETYDLIDLTSKKYKLPIETYFPDREKVEEMVKEKGINLFYDSVENRKLCCHIRKVEPSQRALSGMAVWINGMRKAQSADRGTLNRVAWDNNNNLIKINPLLDWSLDEVWSYIRTNKVPYNVLHDKGYPSLGCQPCTRAVMEGEDIRAGRWWWESSNKKECGLHQGDLKG